MKKTIIVLALIMAVTANAQIEFEAFRYTEALGVAQTSTVRVSGMFEGVHVAFSNKAAVLVSDEDGTADPKSIGQFYINGTHNSSNVYTSFDGLWTLKKTTNHYVVYLTAGSEYTGAAWTNSEDVFVTTNYFANAFATGKLEVAMSTKTMTLDVSALDVNGNKRSLFTNSAVSSSGYFPVRTPAYSTVWSATNVVERIPVMDEWLVVNAKGAESNIAATIRTILNEN